MSKFVLRQSLLLLLTATIWGVAFVAQSVGMEYIGSFTFNAVRNLLAVVVLIPCIAVMNKSGIVRSTVDKETISGDAMVKKEASNNKMLLAGGVCCGVLLCIGSNLQQFGLKETTVGKTGFITTMYIVLVPIFGIFLKKKVARSVWFAIVIAVVGLYLLCMAGGGFSLQRGDALVMMCAVVFSIHILTIDYFAQKVDGVKMACIQFFVCSMLSGICMLLFEEPKIELILQAWLPILYAGVMSCGVGYTLQIVAQRGMNPTVASLILSLESVISVIAGWAILGQELSGRELVGCGLMFAAIILVQLPEKKKS